MADEVEAAPADAEAPLNAHNSVDAASQAIAALLARPGGTADPAEQDDEPAAQPVKAAEGADTEPATEEKDTPAVDVEADDAKTTQPDPKPIARETDETDRKVKEAETAKAESTAARDQLLTTLSQLTLQLDAAIKGEFQDIKSIDDLYALADQRSPKYDPDRYNRYVIAQAKLRDASSQQSQLADAKMKEWRASETDKLHKIMPELKDPEKGPALANKITKFAKDRGYTDQQIGLAGANDIAIIHDAMLYRESQAKAATAATKAKADLEAANKKAAVAPPVQKPGTSRSTNGKDEKAQDDFRRLQKTGSVQDAASVFRSILG